MNLESGLLENDDNLQPLFMEVISGVRNDAELDIKVLLELVFLMILLEVLVFGRLSERVLEISSVVRICVWSP